MLGNWFYDPNSYISSYLEKHEIPSWWHLILVTSRKPLVKSALDCIELPFHRNLIYWPSPTASLEHSLRAIWGAASQAAVLILPQIKLTSHLSKKKENTGGASWLSQTICLPGLNSSMSLTNFLKKKITYSNFWNSENPTDWQNFS